jgi:hypothetical protein
MREPKPKYGRPHRRIKERLRPAVERGTVACARCEQLIRPDEKWDLDHDNLNPARYLGASHSRCNRASVSHWKWRALGVDAAPLEPVVPVACDWRSSYPAEWPPDPDPTNRVTTWSLHWYGTVFNPRCPHCRAAG